MKRYLTTTLPYVNAAPHIGFALEIIRADILVRAWRALGHEVFFNTGTDEHGLKIYQNALEAGKDPRIYADEHAAKFRDLERLLNLDHPTFIRTTDPHHLAAAQEFWRRCAAKGDIYKKNYEVKYCVGCELEKTDSELVAGRCSIHPSREIELIKEENYFFRFSKYQEPLLGLYERYPDFVVPAFRQEEIKQFVSAGLRDFSISRLKAKMPWGVPVPEDETQVMYVWFDALVNYVSTLGWPSVALAKEGKPSKFEEFWGTKEAPQAVQIAGKDNLRQQAAMWQAMLISAGLPTSRKILVNGFITIGGVKMSKSAGRVIDPVALVAEYGADALRFWVAREANAFEDSDFTPEKFKEIYNANLANGLGNLASRILKMAEANDAWPDLTAPGEVLEEVSDQAGIKTAMDAIWNGLEGLDRRVQEKEPFKLVKSDPAKGVEEIKELVTQLWYKAISLKPFLPEAAKRIEEAIQAHKSFATPLFPRK